MLMFFFTMSEKIRKQINGCKKKKKSEKQKEKKKILAIEFLSEKKFFFLLILDQLPTGFCVAVRQCECLCFVCE